MPVEIDSEDEYDKADLIDNVDLKESMTELNESIREQDELLERYDKK